MWILKLRLLPSRRTTPTLQHSPVSATLWPLLWGASDSLDLFAEKKRCSSLVPRISLDLKRRARDCRILTVFFFFDCCTEPTSSRGLFFVLTVDGPAFVMPAN